MMENNNHSDDQQTSKEKEFFGGVKIKYSKSKEDVWASMSDIIGEDESPEKEVKTRVISLSITKWAAAALVLILVGGGLFMRFYSISVEVGAGEFASHTLPDGSEVHLNAESSVSYHPYWWSFNRELEFEGEAFFEVEKGEQFSVVSNRGTTSVLGTSFNIFARGDEYEVFCKTGKVKVENDRSEAVILTPGKHSWLTPEGAMLERQDIQEDEALAWRLEKFIYNTTPIKKVIKDIERHYAVSIVIEADNFEAETYTGLFDRPEKVEDALEAICFNYDWEFEQTSESSYLIK